MVQQVLETSANDVPSGATFSLSYLNMYSLKQETASYSQTMAFIPFIVHDSDNNQFAFDAPEEDTTYTTTFKIGTTVQLSTSAVLYGVVTLATVIRLPKSTPR